MAKYKFLQMTQNDSNRSPRLLLINTPAQPVSAPVFMEPVISFKQSTVDAVKAASQIIPNTVAPAKTQSTSLFNKLIGGAIAGITGTCIIYPLDIVKTRLQNQSRGLAATGAPVYKNGIDAFSQIVRNEGFRGLYRGLPANLVGITPEKAIKLAVNDYAREFFTDRVNARREADSKKTGKEFKRISVDDLPIPEGMASGAIAGVCQVVATNPMEVVKINTQMQIGAKAKGSGEIAKELGIRGVYKGTPATLLRDVPFSFIFFPLSAFTKQKFHEMDQKNGYAGAKPRFLTVFLGGIVAGCVAAVSVTPADVIKTRLQTRSNAATQNYRGIVHCATEVYNKEGARAFFRGSVQRSLIIAPLFGIALMVYEIQQRFISNWEAKK